MRRFALAVLAFGLVFGSSLFADDKAEKQAAKFDPAKMVGKWDITSGKKMGEDIPKDRLESVITWTKDQVEIPAGPDQKFVMAYKVDASKTPAQIDMEIKSGPVPEGKAKGIVSLEGDEFKLCYGVEGMAERPTKFESTADNKAFLFVMKKAKEKKDK